MRTDSWPGLRFADRQCHLTGGGGGGSTSAPNPQDFLPPGQAQVAQQARGLIDPLASQGGFALGQISPQAGPPATYAYPFVTNTFQNQYGTADPSQDPFAGPLLQAGQLSSGIFNNLLYPEATAYSAENANIAGQGIGMLGGIGPNTYGNPLYGQAGQYGAGLAGQYSPEIAAALQGFQSPVFGQVTAAAGPGGNAMFGAVPGLISGGQQAEQLGFGPGYGQLVGAGQQALSQGFAPGYGQASALGQATGDILGQYVNPALQAGFSPNFQSGQVYGNEAASRLGTAAQGILQQSFDPQSALYNRTQQQILDQQNAVNAMSGVASSPYGAGVTGKTLSDFNIDWQNNLLNRMTQGGQAASGLYGQGVSDILNPAAQTVAGAAQGIGAANAAGQGALQNYLAPLQAQLAGMQGGIGTFGGALGQQLAGATGGVGALGGALGAGGNALSGAQGALLNPTIQQLQALNQGLNIGSLAGDRGLQSLLNPAQALTGAFGAGTGAFGNLGSSILGQQQGGLGILSQLGPQAIQSLGAPYNINQGIAGNQFSALGNLISQGNQQYTVPQMAFSDIAQYLGLGQGADQIAAQIAAQNFNQQAASAGGLGSLLGTGANLLGGGRGGGGLFGGGGALSGLFGGGGGLGGAATAGLDFGGGGELGVAPGLFADTSAAAADPLAAAAPFAFS